MAKTLNVFDGPDAVKKFLNPGENSYLPLVELPATLNPFADDNVRIYATFRCALVLHFVPHL